MSKRSNVYPAFTLCQIHSFHVITNWILTSISWSGLTTPMLHRKELRHFYSRRGECLSQNHTVSKLQSQAVSWQSNSTAVPINGILCRVATYGCAGFSLLKGTQSGGLAGPELGPCETAPLDVRPYKQNACSSSSQRPSLARGATDPLPERMAGGFSGRIDWHFLERGFSGDCEALSGPWIPWMNSQGIMNYHDS